MQIGLIGFPQAGKKTLLRLLTQVDARTVPPSQGGVVPGVCRVRDPRVDRLAAMYKPKHVTPATVQYLLMPDLTKDSAKNQELLKALQLVDVLAHVVRAFHDETVFHLEGSVDPRRDMETVHAELVLNDLFFVEKRLERMAKEQGRRSGVDRSKEQAVLSALQAQLNDARPLRTLPLDPEDEKFLSGAPLLSRKPLLLILNADEAAVQDRHVLDTVQAQQADRRVHVVQVSAKIEEELSQLEDPSERASFLTALGIAESAIDRLTRVSYAALGLISYFTVGSDEVRAWTIRRGACAAEAGGVIHSDIERGFIRAELMTYEDLVTLGSEQAVASAGKAHLKGKEYIVQDGDVLSFRFNV
ncbi:MAG: redox-regulated ATPase YchF [Candidatus Omnitrophica bacterium]|nr:redox-regulated ATPase YchF [Candidatus Omnitrophota bacterium]